MKFVVLLVLLSLFSNAARAQEEPIRLDLRLTASDLVDELVYTWLKSSPFQGSTPLIVAEVDAPIGLDIRFEQDIENHLFDVLRANPSLPVQLVHCSLCRQWVVSSNPKKTTLGRALNQADGQEALRAYPHLLALSLHFEVVQNELALWAEVYETAPPQRVVWARRFSQSTSARTILREPTRLVSIDEARAEQRKLFEGRDNLQTVTRFPIRTYSASDNGQGAQIPPLIFIEQSVEAVVSPKKNRRAGLALGLTSLKDTLQGWTFGASYEQLLFRDEPSLTEPDLYWRAAITYMHLEGPGAAVFSQNQLDVNALINSKDDPKASMTAFQIGLEAHIKYRFGISAFIEYVPVLETSNIIGTQHLLVPYQTLGFAGVFLW